MVNFPRAGHPFAESPDGPLERYRVRYTWASSEGLDFEDPECDGTMGPGGLLRGSWGRSVAVSMGGCRLTISRDAGLIGSNSAQAMEDPA